MLANKAHQPGSNYSSPVPKPEEFTGYELRSVTGKGEGVFATRSFKPKELVIKGIISKSGIDNNTHAAQVGVNVFIRQAGLVLYWPATGGGGGGGNRWGRPPPPPPPPHRLVVCLLYD